MNDAPSEIPYDDKLLCDSNLLPDVTDAMRCC